MERFLNEIPCFPKILRIQIYVDHLNQFQEQLCKVFLTLPCESIFLDIRKFKFRFQYKKTKEICESICSLFAALGGNENIKKIKCSVDQIFSRNILPLIQNPNLTTLCLDSSLCFSTSSSNQNFKFSAFNLEKLTIKGIPTSPITTEGAIYLLTALRGHPMLKKLSLEKNYLKYQKSDLLNCKLSSLIESTGIRSLNISNNPSVILHLNSIPNSSTLFSLNLRNVGIHFHTIQWRDNKSIQKLFLRESKIKELTKSFMECLPCNVMVLDLSKNVFNSKFKISDVFDDLENLLPWLNVFHISYNNFLNFDGLIRYISNVKRLTELYVFEGSNCVSVPASSALVDAFLSNHSLQICDHKESYCIQFSQSELDLIYDQFTYNSTSWNRTKSAGKK